MMKRIGIAFDGVVVGMLAALSLGSFTPAWWAVIVGWAFGSAAIHAAAQRS